MNLMHLKYVVEISRSGSISRAAENLYMGQPNLSRAVRELEEELGITIFNRTARGITLTAEGEEFMRYARSIISSVSEVEEIYKGGREKKQRLAVCVPRASYISYALSDFASYIKTNRPAEIYYKETNSMRAISSVTSEEYDLAIIRYLTDFDRKFEELFENKGLMGETVCEFNYKLLVSKNSPLACAESISEQELAGYIQISHPDQYVPSVAASDIRSSEMPADKHIFVFERGSQFNLLDKVPTTYMWVSPVPQELCDRYGLVQRECSLNRRVYRDMLIYRKNYRMTDLDNLFISAVVDSRRKYMG